MDCTSQRHAIADPFHQSGIIANIE